MESGPRLSIRGLSVSFGSNRALDGLDLDVSPGTIVALLGANGSGKSTAVKALSGINQTEPGGSMQLNGRSVELSSLDPVVARQSGIRVVHQEAPLVPDLTVAEAVALSVGFPTASGFIRQKEMNRRAEALLAEFSIDIDVRRLCRSLSPAERSLVSFAIAIGDIGVDHAVLILDEATASLSTGDAERFLVKVRESADRGLAVLMVTHRLPEVREHCDSTVVLRDGKVVDSFDRDTFDEMAVVRAMVGPEGPAEAAHSSEAGSATGIGNRIVATALRGGGLSDVTFAANHGEILGVTGRTGGGASELLRLIGGMDETEGGALQLGDATLTVRSPRDAIASGIFYLSADRLVEGGVPALSVAENLVLPKVERYGWSRSKPAADVASMMTLLDIRPPDSTVAFGGLSGGNQQKVLLARWLLLNPRVLLLDDPTAGVDPNTREVIFSNLKSLAQAGTTVIFRSTEPEQLARLCQRVLVMREGRIVTELSNDQLTIEEISLATYA